jgi:hypothetical protein
MKITGRALYLRWNGDDRNRWSALPVTSKGKWEMLAEMYSGDGFSQSIDVSDRIPPETSPSAGEWPGGTKVKSSEPALVEVSDDEIFEQAKAFLQKAVDEAINDPKIRELVANALVGGTGADWADVHTSPTPDKEPDALKALNLSHLSPEKRAWLLDRPH